MKKIIALSLISVFIPMFVFAAESASITSLTTLIDFLSETLATRILPLLIGVAVVAFVYGILQYFLNPDNEEKRKKGKEYLVWGLVGLFVMISFWGIIGVLQNTFNTKTNSSGIKIPGIPEQE